MLRQLLLFAACLCVTISQQEVSSSVVPLGVANFTEYIHSHRFALIMFYAPWCSHSQTFSPQFDAISASITDAGLGFGKVDCVAEEGLYNTQKIEGLGGFPTLKGFVNGEVDDGIHFTGERDTQEILAFIRKYSTQSYVDLDSPDGAALVLEGSDSSPLDSFVNQHVLSAEGGAAAAVLFVEDPLPSGPVAAFVTAAINSFDLACKKASLTGCATVKSNSKTHLALYRNYPDEDERVVLDGVVEDGAVSSAEMLQFMKTAGYPNVVEFTEANDPLMFDDKRPGFNTHVVFFLDSATVDGDKKKTFLESVRSLAATYKTRAVFIHLDTADRSQYVRQILEDVNISSTDTPAAMIINSLETKVQFYRFDSAGAESGVLDVSNVASWVESFFAGTLIPMRTSMTEPYF